MAKRASIYFKSGVFYVVTSHKTLAGFWIDDKIIDETSSNVSHIIDEMVRQALSRSKDGVATPSPSVDLLSPLLSRTGEKTWSKFVSGTKYVGVREIDDTIKVTPYKNLGTKEGFEPIDDGVVILSKNSSTLGKTVLDAFLIAS